MQIQAISNVLGKISNAMSNIQVPDCVYDISDLTFYLDTFEKMTNETDPVFFIDTFQKS